MSQWGLSVNQAVSLTEGQIKGLLAAYIERKKFEAKITVSVFGEALKPRDKAQPMSFGSLAAMGFEIEGA